MKRQLTPGAVVISMLGMFVLACSSPSTQPAPQASDTPKTGGVLTAAIRSDPNAWDPWGTQRVIDPDRSSMDMVFNALVAPAAKFGTDCDLEWVPELAEKWTYIDDKTLEFKLRQGVKWQDKPPVNGREFVADDVVYNMQERYRNGPASKTFLGQEVIARVEATDKYTVRFHLKQSYNVVTALHVGGWAWMVPKEAAGPDGQAWIQKPELSWIGTGPFMFKEFQSGVKLVFDKNPNYFKPGLPYVDRVELLVVPDESTKQALLRSGKLDINWAAAPSSVSDIRRTNPSMFIKACPGNVNVTLAMRLDKAPYNDIRVRQAMSMAINRDAIIRTILGGDGNWVPWAWPGHAEALSAKDYPLDIRKYLEHRPDEARKLLAEAGYPQGFKSTILYSESYGSPFNEITEAYVTMLREVGIDVQLRPMEYVAYMRVRIVSLDYADLLMGWSQLSIPDETGGGMWSKNPTPGQNYIHAVKDTKLDGIIEEMWRTLDPDKHKALAHDMQRHLVQQAYALNSPAWSNSIIAQPWVKNLGWRTINKIYGPFMEQAWISK